METIIPSLYASPPEPLPFGSSLEIRAYLLKRERGNLLVYRAATLEHEAQSINALGGVSRQYLNHHHEASPACAWVTETFDAPLHVHAEDASAVSENCNVAATFAERHTLDDDFEVIPTPGHTPGATAYLWDTGEHRVLFPGDTLFFPQGKWRAAVLESSEREPYIASLELIHELEFDLIVPSVTASDQPFYATTTSADALCRIAEVLDRLRRGENA